MRKVNGALLSSNINMLWRHPVSLWSSGITHAEFIMYLHPDRKLSEVDMHQPACLHITATCTSGLTTQL